MLHNFTPEVVASHYEKRLVVDEGLNFRPLRPRVVMLLENVEAIEQFVWLTSYGKIREISTDNEPYRWQLEWERGDRFETIWLTYPWLPQADGARRPKPDIINALHGFVIRGTTYEPGRTIRVSHDFARAYIRQLDKDRDIDMGKKIDAINYHLANEKGIVSFLTQASVDEDYLGLEERRVKYEDFADLATVVRFILVDRLADLETRLKSKQDGDSGIWGDPFAASSPNSSTEG